MTASQWTGSLAALVACAVVVLMQLYVAIPLAPVVESEFAADGGSVALATSFGLAYAAGFLIFGALSDR